MCQRPAPFAAESALCRRQALEKSTKLALRPRPAGSGATGRLKKLARGAQNTPDSTPSTEPVSATLCRSESEQPTWPQPQVEGAAGVAEAQCSLQ